MADTMLSSLASAPLPHRGLTITDVARRYRVKRDKVRAWIRRGELRAVNTATAACGKPRFVVTAEALVEFERRRTATPAKPMPRRRRRWGAVDYYPD
jgi:transposase